MTTLPIYSTLFSCLYDEQKAVSPSTSSHYSIFRAIDRSDVAQKVTPRPRVHDFAVIWDDDHDDRIIAVIEEMLMSGLLPGVQFIGEHKGMLTVILAAKTYWLIDVADFQKRVENLTVAAGDWWSVEVGMFDHCSSSIQTGHQCDFRQIVGCPLDFQSLYLRTIDALWKLGTKEWMGVEAEAPSDPKEALLGLMNRYCIYTGRGKRVEPNWQVPLPPVPPT